MPPEESSATRSRFNGRLSDLNIADHLQLGVQLLTVSAPLGMLVGVAIAGYDYVVNTLLWEHLSSELSRSLLCLMPIIGMLLTWVVVTIGHIKWTSMADEVVRAYHHPDEGLNYRQSAAKLTASLATMGFGGSAGMEGASKWVGAIIGGFIQTKLNRLRRWRFMHAKVEITMLAGAAAGISAIFRAPLTGAIMGVESPYKHDMAHEALLHGLVASAMSYLTFTAIGSATPYFSIHVAYTLNWRDLLVCVPLGLVAGLSSHLFLGTLSAIKRIISASRMPSFYFYLLGGVLLSLLAYASCYVVGEPVTLQAGLPEARRLLHGDYTLQICLFIFLVKMLATVITFGCGGVGGLFIPSATIGAALGAACDSLFPSMQPGLFTLMGIAAFTGASYNSLLFAAVFIAEATGSAALVVPGLVASTVAFVTSAGVSNSGHQKLHR